MSDRCVREGRRAKCSGEDGRRERETKAIDKGWIEKNRRKTVLVYGWIVRVKL
jgi:hypothetical protein